MNAPYRPKDSAEAQRKELLDFLYSASGDVAAIRDAIKANTAVNATIAACLAKLVEVAEKGGRHD